MAAIPPPTKTVAARIYAALENVTEKPRPHLGASIIGHHCERFIWLSFRWAVIEKFPGRIRRLFRRGHLEESQVINDLRAAGLTVDDHDRKTRQQFAIKDGHFGGSLDGIVHGVPEAPNKPHVLEIKTHGLKSFKALVADGVKASKPQHYAQMQVYMLKMEIDRALYFAVCKDDDKIYTERVRLDKAFALSLVDKAQRLIASDRPPPPISTDPTWYQCKICAAYDFCHDYQLAKEVNCRTCAHVTARPDGSWHCARWDSVIPDQESQLAGCRSHVLHPDLAPWKMKESDSEWEAIYLIDGTEVRNGEGGYSSAEIIANPLLCAAADPFVERVRRDFGGEVVG